MADFVFNIARGRVAELVRRVDEDGSPKALLVIPINATGATEADMKDAETLAALEAVPSVALSTNTGFGTRETIVAAGIATTDYDPDDINDDIDVGKGFADIIWTSVANDGTGAVTGIVICYDADTGAGDDTNIIPLTHHDFSITPNGGDITAQISDTLGFYNAASS